MSGFLTEEQQVERVKVFWKQYGNWVVNVALIAVIALAGWQFWQGRQLSQQEKASVLYQEMMLQVLNHDASGIEAYGKRLQESFPQSIYANFAGLHLARLAIQNKAYAKADQHLNQVLRQAPNSGFKQIVRLRQARLRLAQGKPQAALTLLDTVDDHQFDALIAETRGDVYVALGQLKLARAQYQLAVAALPADHDQASLLTMKLNHLPLAKQPEKA